MGPQALGLVSLCISGCHLSHSHLTSLESVQLFPPHPKGWTRLETWPNLIHEGKVGKEPFRAESEGVVQSSPKASQQVWVRPPIVVKTCHSLKYLEAKAHGNYLSQVLLPLS